MNKTKKIALLLLMSTSIISTPCFAGKDKEQATYEAVAKWIMSVNWYKKLKLKTAVDKCKEIEWSKVAKAIQDLYSKK